MKKFYIVLFAVLLVGSISAQAQSIKFGVLGGANFSNISSSDPDDVLNNLTAFHAGLMAEMKFSMIGVELDAIYSQTGTKIDVLGTDFELKNTYIALPLVAKVYFLKFINVQAGPQFSFLTNSELDGVDFKDQLESNDLQIVFGAGVDLNMFHASLRYTLGVKDISTDTDIELKNNAVMLTVGIWLKK